MMLYPSCAVLFVIFSELVFFPTNREYHHGYIQPDSSQPTAHCASEPDSEGVKLAAAAAAP